MRPKFKYVRAFQNNGPDYFLLFTGSHTFKADPIARCDHERDAKRLVDSLNLCDELADTLERVLIASEYNEDTNAINWEEVRTVLQKAKG